MPDRPSRVRPIALAASVALAVSLATCARESAGPPRHAALSVAPVLPSGTSLAAFNLSIDNVRLIVVRPAADTVFDQTFAFPANQSSLSLSADVPLEQSPETFQVTIQLLSATTVLFTGTQAVPVTADQATPPTPISLTYSGPGQNVASLTIGPLDSVLTQGATLQFRLTAKDAQGVTVDTFYASWSTSDPSIATIDPAGVLTAPLRRAIVNVVARTPPTQSQPNGVTTSTPITFIPTPNTVSAIGGCPQSGAPGVQLPQAFVVQVNGADGLGVRGVRVQFSAASGGGSVTPASDTTNSQGQAQALLTLGASAGANVFQASVAGVATPAICNATAVGATQLAVSLSPGSVTAGTTASVTVTAKDGSGNTATGYRGTVHFTSSDAQAVVPADYPFSAADNGVHTFTNGVTLKTAGNQSVTATDIATSSITGSGSSTVAAAAAATVLKISGDNQTGAGGAPLAQPLVIEVRDAFTNPVANATVSWATGSGGSLAPPSGLTGSNGRAQSAWTLGTTVSSQSATASVGTLTPVSFSATANITQPVLSLSFAGIPGVGVGLTAKVYVDIDQAAPAGGTAVTVASGNTSFFTVTPGLVTIPQGKTRDSVTVTGVASGTTELTASAAGYTSGTLTVVVQNRNISVPQTLNVPYGQTASLPIQLPAPAPAGGVTFSVVSSDPGVVSITTPSVTIAAGSQAANATLSGVLPGTATVTVSNPAYSDGVTAATTTASLNIVEASATLNASFGTSVTIRFESNGGGAAAPSPGISVTLVATDSKCLAATSPVLIPTGLVSTTATLSYGGSATLPCTTKLLAQAANLQPDSIAVTVNPVPGIMVGALTVGSGLQDNTTFTLGAANHGNIDVTIASSDPKVLVAPNAATPGSSQITVPVADGVTSVSFWVQALEGRTADTVRATLTVSAPGFSNGTAIATAQQAALDLQGVPTTTTTLSPSNFIFARVGIATATNSALSRLQVVRAGATAPLTVTFTVPADGVGELFAMGVPAGTAQSATIPVGQSNSPTDTTGGGVAFDPLKAGTTTVDAAITGFIATTAAKRAVTVSQPGITVGAVTVGSGLEDVTNFTLGASSHGGVNVLITSADPSAILVSPDAATPGTPEIVIPVPDGATTRSFYVQALEGRTSDTMRVAVTVSAPGFSDGTATMTAQQAALDLQGVPTTTTTLSPSNFIFARVGIATATNSALSRLQVVRAGAPGPVTVSFTTPAGVAQLLAKGGLAGPAQSATIAIGQTSTPGDTTSGGVAFDPLLSGTTTVGATIQGFIATTAATRAVTVSQPGITVGAVTVGSGLQDVTSFTLGAPNHGAMDVTITSSNPVLLVAPNASTQGANQITIPVADGVTSVNFFVQGLEGQTQSAAATVTVSAPGFLNGTATETVVVPALDLQGVPTTMTAGGADANIFVRVGVPVAGNGSLSRLQAVRAGLPGGSFSFTITSSNVSVATLVDQGGKTGSPQTVLILSGQSSSPTTVAAGGVGLRPVAGGSSSISAVATGFITTANGSRSVTVQ